MTDSVAEARGARTLACRVETHLDTCARTEGSVGKRARATLKLDRLFRDRLLVSLVGQDGILQPIGNRLRDTAKLTREKCALTASLRLVKNGQENQQSETCHPLDDHAHQGDRRNNAMHDAR